MTGTGAERATEDVDFLVVGGGVHGTAVAHELARSGAEVMLLERRTVACGASGGLGKRGVRANGRDPRELPLMRIAYDIWPGLADLLGGETGYERLGGLEIAEALTTEDELAWSAMQAQAQVQLAHDIPTETVDRAGLRTLEPGIGPLPRAALYCPLDGVADHTATTRAYAVAASRSGAKVLEDTEVVALRTAGGATLAETADGRRFRGRVATIALVNSYASALLGRSYGLQLPTWRLAPQVCAVEPPDGFVLRHLIGHRTRKLAAKMLPGGTLMLSGGLRGRWDTEQDVGLTDAGVPAKSLADATDVFPGVSGARLVETDASRAEACTVDDVPIIDRVPGAEGLYFATGWSGHGFAIAPAVARLLADWVRTGERPRELAPFGLDRLGL